MVSRAFRVSRGISLAITVGGVISSSLPSSLKEAETRMNLLRTSVRALDNDLADLRRRRDVLPVTSAEYKRLEQQIGTLTDKRKVLNKESRNHASILQNLKRNSERTVQTLRRTALVVGAATTVAIGFGAAIVGLLNDFRRFDALTSTASFGAERLQRSANLLDLMGVNGEAAAATLADLNTRFTLLFKSGRDSFDRGAIALSGIGFNRLQSISQNLSPTEQLGEFRKHFKTIENDLNKIANFRLVLGGDLFEAVRISAQLTNEEYQEYIKTSERIKIIDEANAKNLFFATKQWSLLGKTFKSTSSVLAISLTPGLIIVGKVLNFVGGGLLGFIDKNETAAKVLSFLTAGLIVASFVWAGWVAVTKVARTTMDLYGAAAARAAIITGVKATVTGAATIAQFLFALATGKATIALSGFGIAMIVATGGLVLIGAAIALIILNWKSLVRLFVQGAKTILGWLERIPFIGRLLGGRKDTNLNVSYREQRQTEDVGRPTPPPPPSPPSGFPGTADVDRGRSANDIGRFIVNTPNPGGEDGRGLDRGTRRPLRPSDFPAYQLPAEGQPGRDGQPGQDGAIRAPVTNNRTQNGDNRSVSRTQFTNTFYIEGSGNPEAVADRVVRKFESGVQMSPAGR